MAKKKGEKESKEKEQDETATTETRGYRKKKRDYVPMDFYNEIVHSDEETLDTGRVTGCCPADGTSVMDIGKEICAQELNITRIVAA